MPRRGKDSSTSNSTNNDGLDEIKVLLNEKFDEFSNKLVSTEVWHHCQRDWEIAIDQDGTDRKESRRHQS